jgi:hypothetical protein
LSAYRQPGPKSSNGVISQGDQALFSPFSHDPDDSILPQQRGKGQGDDFRSSRSCGIHKLQDRFIPDSFACRKIHLLQDPVYLAFREDFGQGPDPFGTFHFLHGRSPKAPFPHKKGVKLFKRGIGPIDGGRSIILGSHPLEIFEKVLAGKFRESSLSAPGPD